MSNTNPFITHIRDLIEKDAVKAAIQELSAFQEKTIWFYQLSINFAQLIMF